MENISILDKPGIYKIINLINSKVYIGASKNLRKRKNQHWSELKRNTHSNNYLQKSVSKYGIENFKFEIIEFCNSLEDLDYLEEFFINKYNSTNKTFGYNLTNKSNYLNSQRTKEQIQKSANKHKKPIIQLDLDGNIINKWDCAKNAALHYNINKTHISGCCCGRYGSKTYKGFIWIFEKYYNKEKLKEQLFLYKNRNTNLILKIDLLNNKEVKIFKSYSEVEKEDKIYRYKLRNNINKHGFLISNNFKYIKYEK